MSKQEYRPNHLALKDHIERIYRVSPQIEGAANYLSLATGSFRLAFNIHKKAKPVSGGNAQIHSSILLRGAASKPVLVEALSDAEQYSVIFKPHGLSHFTRTPLTELADKDIDATAIFGSSAVALASRLEENPGDPGNFALIEAFLLESYTPYDVRMVQEAFRLINAGEDNVTAMCNQLHCEERTLRRHFKKFTGVSIKSQIKINRMSKVWEVLKTEPGKRNIDIALENGFSDQAHYNREVKMMSGFSPGEIRQIEKAEHYKRNSE